MLVPPPLQKICIAKTCSFLVKGLWENCEDNPFSFMPPVVVQALLSCMLPTKSKLAKGRIGHSKRLLTSGRLQHVRLHFLRRLREANHGQLFRMLSHGCQMVRTLTLPLCHLPVETLPELLQNCFNLERLMSPLCIDPYHLRNCKKLKRLALHFDYEATMEFFSYLSPDRLLCLASLEVLHFENRIRPKTADGKERLFSATIKMLDACTELISLGSLDSAKAIHAIHGRDGRTLKTARHFKLRRCSWKIREDIGQLEYSEVIKVASLSCPQVELLKIDVRYADSLKHLRILKNLTTLNISFSHCACEFDHEFYALLNEIGPQLRLLCLSWKRKKPHLNSPRNDDSNTLPLQGEGTAKEPVLPYVNLLRLKTLTLYECDRRSLFFILSNAIHLKRFLLKDATALDDDLLSDILRKNTFSKLEVVEGLECSLSELGLTRFVQMAGKLRKFYLASSPLIDVQEVEQCLKRANPSLIIRPKQ